MCFEVHWLEEVPEEDKVEILKEIKSNAEFIKQAVIWVKAVSGSKHNIDLGIWLDAGDGWYNVRIMPSSKDRVAVLIIKAAPDSDRPVGILYIKELETEGIADWAMRSLRFLKEWRDYG